jgi:hypothetical protein
MTDLQRTLDRLADDELPHADRRALLESLDADPTPASWKLCALTFLEAQVLRRAFRPVTALSETPRVLTGRRLLPRLAMAAGVLAAFGVGRVSTPVPSAPLPTPVVVQTPPPTPAEVPAAAPIRPSAPTPRLSAEDRRLASRGIKVEHARRLVAVRLTDGREVVVPVQETRLRYVGNQTL